MLRIVFAGVLVLLPLGAHAVKDTYAVQLMRQDVASARLSLMLVKTGGTDADSSKESDEIRRLKEKLGSDMQLAVKQFKDKPDIVKAIKEFYLAATTYLDTSTPGSAVERANYMRLESDLSAKESALNMEMKLAGFDS